MFLNFNLVSIFSEHSRLSKGLKTQKTAIWMRYDETFNGRHATAVI